MPPEEATFFLDRCLGAHIAPDALRAAGARVELHGAHFADDASEEEILRAIGARRWAFLSKDRRIRHRPAEFDALRDAEVAAFILTSGNAKGEAVAAAFVRALDRMQRILQSHVRPFVATVSVAGKVKVDFGGRRGAAERHPAQWMTCARATHRESTRAPTCL